MIFSRVSTVGFALIGPLCFLPYCLMCVAFSKPKKWMPPWLFALGIAFFLFCGGLGLAWPFIVLFT
jgi:hypothetical protein